MASTANIDAIISGHTHLAYNHAIPVPAWIQGRAVTTRPVVSAGQYGYNLNQLVFTVDNATGQVQAKTQDVVPFASFPATGDAATQAIVNDANAKAAASPVAGKSAKGATSWVFACTWPVALSTVKTSFLRFSPYWPAETTGRLVTALLPMRGPERVVVGQVGVAGDDRVHVRATR